jgi:hypothetical protein
MITLIYTPVSAFSQSDVPIMILEESLELCIVAFNNLSFNSFESLFSEDEDNFIAFDENGDYKKIEKSFVLVD